MNVFAHTEPGGNYPGYVSINQAENGDITVTVRAKPKFYQISGYPEGCVEAVCGDQADLTIPANSPDAAILAALSRPSADFAAVVEQCARVAEEWVRTVLPGERVFAWEQARNIAAAIRSIQAPDGTEPMGQAATAAWMGVDVTTMNLAHDCLHHALCDAFKVPSRAMRQAAGETLDPAEQHLADLEENAVLHVQRWLHAAGVL